MLTAVPLARERRGVRPAVEPEPDVEVPYHPDDGCQYAPRCLECWLPACALDAADAMEIARLTREETDRRWAEIRAAAQDGATQTELMARFGVSRRTVQRALKGRRS